MKNKIYYFGIICCLLVVFGCLFKIQHWAGAGIILTLGFFIFSLVYIPVALVNSYRSEKDKKLKWLYILAFLNILIICAGALFKIQHWPGAGQLLLWSIPLPFILFLPFYLLYVNKNKQLNYTNLLLVLFFFAYFGAITALLSLNVSKNILDESIVASLNYEHKVMLTDNQTLALMGAISKSEVSDSIKRSALNIKDKSDNINKLIDQLKIDIINLFDKGNQQFITEDGNINLWNIIGKDNNQSNSREVLNDKIIEIRKRLNEFRGLLLSGIKYNDRETITYIDHLLNKQDTLWEGDKNMFGQRLVFLLQILDFIKKDVGLATYEAISALEKSNTLN